MVSTIDKIDVEQLLADFRVSNKEALQVYLKELWKDLSQRSEDKTKGINRITFAKVSYFYDYFSITHHLTLFTNIILFSLLIITK